MDGFLQRDFCKDIEDEIIHWTIQYFKGLVIGKSWDSRAGKTLEVSWVAFSLDVTFLCYELYGNPVVADE